MYRYRIVCQEVHPPLCFSVCAGAASAANALDISLPKIRRFGGWSLKPDVPLEYIDPACLSTPECQRFFDSGGFGRHSLSQTPFPPLAAESLTGTQSVTDMMICDLVIFDLLQSTVRYRVPLPALRYVGTS